MKLQFSKKLQDKLKKEGSLNTIREYIFKLSFFSSIVRYITNWRYMSVRHKLSDWIKDNIELTDEVKEDVEYITKIKDDDTKIKYILKYVNKLLRYYPDTETWKIKEYWASAIETINLKRGDCEDGAILIYAIAKYCGITDDRIYIVCGSVVGGGHCYIVYIADDMLEYVIDWCYWYNRSVTMNNPYITESNYYNGNKEWFRFNASGSWKPQKLYK